MITYLWLLLFPLVWPIISKYIWPAKINWTEMIINMVGICVITSLVYYAGTFSTTIDTEIWNGYVIDKNRDHGTYEQPYDCFCTTDSKGNRSCQTCYETHYTVTWTASTTVGNIFFDKKDSTSRSVYLSPDPDAFERCKVGEPASIEHNFTNYVKAVPESLFGDSGITTNFQNMIPNYPRVYDFYRINRVIDVGGKVPNVVIKELNNGLNDMLRSMGSEKQVNIIVLFVNTTDASYRFALEKAWLGGKKNDIVVMIGVTDYPNVAWLDIMTWAKNIGNEEFRLILRDALISMKTIDTTNMLSTISKVTRDNFTRPHMRDFEYLKDEIVPPMWAIIICLIMSIGGSLGVSYFFYKNEIDDIVSDIVTDLNFKLTKMFKR